MSGTLTTERGSDVHHAGSQGAAPDPPTHTAAPEAVGGGGADGPGSGEGGGGGGGEGDDEARRATGGDHGHGDARAGRPWPTPLRTQRTLQVVLGAFWILDAALQYQPFMFGDQFVPRYITANAAGQPEPVSWLITTAGHFVSPDVVAINALAATLQLLIGVGLLFRRTVRPALAVSMAWVLTVWFFGEGMGMLLTGSASALTGAPGSVLLYGLLGLMAWPRTAHGAGETAAVPDEGVASSAAGRGLGGPVTPLAVWAGYWLLAALLFLLPANRTATSVSGAITSMAAGQPSWYGHALTHAGGWFGSAGLTQTWLLALAAVVVGLGPLLFRRAEGFLAAGFVLTVLFWLTGQGVGGVLTGSGTDPNTGPLVAILALAMVPTVVPSPRTWTPPALQLVRQHPSLSTGLGLGVLCALLLAATYPAAAESAAGSGSAMPGMSGMALSGSSMTAMSPSSQSGRTARCTSDVAHSGLDVTNPPLMAMGSAKNATMNMNGADASAAAGLNATTPNWSYTGPALPPEEANTLLTDGANGPTDIRMAASGCTHVPTFGQEIGAFSYVQATSQAASRYPTPADAAAAGYQLVSPADYPVTYYVNPDVVAANAAARRTLDPSAIDGLVYAQTPSGQQVLAAAMYILPGTVSEPPMPYGALVQWHQRTNVCGPAATGAAGPLQITGFPPCQAGSPRRPTPDVTMVWQLPVAGGPLAVQPPDIQIVEAAVMQSS